MLYERGGSGRFWPSRVHLHGGTGCIRHIFLCHTHSCAGISARVVNPGTE
ncbi:unnamed protein product [Nippostrongylus brasiliensis]|uniref:Uncharacterized protein n=1 Tax=Nippostrongylus brasiliensis TaxID=27835 RepID=A0A0N4XDC2_NIPBR|nr:unnamed protein product [Nippostrongylus brasiliensis]